MGSFTPTSPSFLSIPLSTSLPLLSCTAIATDGTRGIGRSITLELAHRGASVAIIYVNPKNGERTRETVAEIKVAGVGVRAVAVQAYLKDPGVGERIVQETLEGLGVRKIDILSEFLDFV
jgi:3-oxoacyl-[acyl-carrier protein] reductase